MIFLILLLLLPAFFVLLNVFFCILLQNVLEEIEIHNRAIHPNLVWLNMIPIFNLFLSFYLNPKICNAVKRQLEENDYSENDDYGVLLGKAFPLLVFAAIIIWIPGIQLLLIISSVICLLMFWSKMSENLKKLKETRSKASYLRGADNNNLDLLD